MEEGGSVGDYSAGLPRELLLDSMQKIILEEGDGCVRDWAGLPRELLDLIVDRLLGLSDFIRFGSVCKSWRGPIADHQCHRYQQQLLQLLKTYRNQIPLLLTSTEDNSNTNRTLHVIKEEGVERCLQIQLPMPCSTRFIGSSQGWLIMVDQSLIITLIHPFLDRKVVLPKFEVPTEEYQEYVLGSNSFDHEYNIVKAIILPHSCQNKGQEETNSLEVLLIYSMMGTLAYINTSQEYAAWKPIKVEARPGVIVLSDIISFNGQVYAVSLWGALVHVDVITRKCTILIANDEANRGGVFAKTTYLVESQDGDLLFVRRYLSFRDENSRLHETCGMGVYKLSSLEHDENPKWVIMRTIGEQALFLGDNYSMSISTRDFPQYYKRNCVYYLDHFFGCCGRFVPRGVEDDNGVFNEEEGSFKRFTYYTPDASHKPPSTPSIWIVPSFY